MTQLMLFGAQLALLFLLARSFAKNFYQFWFLLLKSPHWAAKITSVFLLPGTVVHELSHWLTAEILQVTTGKISFWPALSERGDLKLGSVEIVKTDPFRRTMIGLAPLVMGMALIVLASQFMSENVFECGTRNCLMTTLTGGVAIFMISNTMFSSKKDMEAAFVPFTLICLVGLAWWYLAWQVPEIVLTFAEKSLMRLNPIFTLTLIIDGVLLMSTKLLMRLFEKILRRTVVEHVD